MCGLLHIPAIIPSTIVFDLWGANTNSTRNRCRIVIRTPQVAGDQATAAMSKPIAFPEQNAVLQAPPDSEDCCGIFRAGDRCKVMLPKANMHRQGDKKERHVRLGRCFRVYRDRRRVG